MLRVVFAITPKENKVADLRVSKAITILDINVYGIYGNTLKEIEARFAEEIRRTNAGTPIGDFLRGVQQSFDRGNRFHPGKFALLILQSLPDDPAKLHIADQMIPAMLERVLPDDLLRQVREAQFDTLPQQMRGGLCGYWANINTLASELFRLLEHHADDRTRSTVAFRNDAVDPNRSQIVFDNTVGLVIAKQDGKLPNVVQLITPLGSLSIIETDMEPREIEYALGLQHSRIGAGSTYSVKRQGEGYHFSGRFTPVEGEDRILYHIAAAAWALTAHGVRERSVKM